VQREEMVDHPNWGVVLVKMTKKASERAPSLNIANDQIFDQSENKRSMMDVGQEQVNCI
jgi:hypothetical protein